MKLTVKALNSKLTIQSDNIDDVVDILAHIILNDSYELTITDTAYGEKRTLNLGLYSYGNIIHIHVLDPNTKFRIINAREHFANDLHDVLHRWRNFSM